MIKQAINGIFGAGVVALSLSGCADVVRDTKKIDDNTETVNAMRALTERNAAKASVIRTTRPRFAGEEVVLRTSEFPSSFDQRDSYNTHGSQSLQEVLDDIALTRGIKIRAAEIISTGQTAATPGQGIPGAGVNPLAANITLDYSGTTRGLLDAIAAKADASYRWNKDTSTVEFFRYESRTLYISLPAPKKDIAASISLSGVGGSGGGGGGGGGGGSSSGNVAVSQSMTVNPWASIMDGIGTILKSGQQESGAQAQQPQQGSSGVLTASGPAGTAIATPELGMIMVTARPQVADRVARFVSTVNARYANNLLIDVKIYSVTLNRESSLGFNLNMLYSTVDKLGGSIVGPAPQGLGTGTPGVLTLTSQNPASPWNGSQLVAKALSQFGKVSLAKQGQVLAVNGQPAPIQVANEISYVASSSTTTAPNVGAVTTQTQGTKVVGFTANFLPLVLGDNRILLNYQMQISALAAPLVPNAQGVVSPNIATQSTQQQAFLRDGQAIVVFGYDEERTAANSVAGIGAASGASTSDRQMLVTVIQVNAGEKNGQK